MPVRRQISPHAARLRREKTDAEQRFWLAVRDRRLGGFKFRQQHSFYPYVADFCCVQARLVVEIDGGQHTPANDARRTAFINESGYRVLRFWNNDVIENLDGVLQTVLNALEASVDK